MAEARHALGAAVFEERTVHEVNEAAFRARWHENPPDTNP
ncbi:hypothetical protein Vqi01_58890 [Micromonospora qiuiae]|uniref:Uncharacterized protein n=1 Tax=Micromonospora qiuiae TaxID=502268 RepID=A0ABQ4JMJ5_9ACTN|nr:hypothetical protein Vqi01_58890 [Micromonospora qiuiae]